MSKDLKIAESLASTITLNDGVEMPMFGLGVSKAESGEGGDAEKAVTCAINNGYILVDTATRYRNESDAGRGVHNSSVSRDNVFIVTKLWVEHHGTERVKREFMASLKRLDIDYVDLYLMHGPQFGQVVETYRAMHELKKSGYIRSIGVSNFAIHHLEGLKKEGLPLPSVNQIELHPWMRRQELVDYCRKEGIVIMGYSPLAKAFNMTDERLNAIAKKYNKSPAQILLRWAVQNGFITIPKSVKPHRIIENTQVFDWTLKDEDFNALSSFEEGSVFPEWGWWRPLDSEWKG